MKYAVGHCAKAGQQSVAWPTNKVLSGRPAQCSLAPKRDVVDYIASGSGLHLTFHLLRILGGCQEQESKSSFCHSTNSGHTSIISQPWSFENEQVTILSHCVAWPVNSVLPVTRPTQVILPLSPNHGLSKTSKSSFCHTVSLRGRPTQCCLA
jgi:hypothetical protein